MDIALDYYRIFEAVARHRSFTRAAEALVNSQPNLTRAVHNLEAELGCRLFLRSSRGVELTPEGEALYAHVTAAMEQLRAGEAELQRQRELRSGMVSIACSETALHAVLLQVLSRFHRENPAIRLRVSNQSAPEAIDALRSGLAELAVVTMPPAPLSAPLEATVLASFREVAVCSMAFPLDSGRTFTLREIAALPLIALRRGTSTFDLYEALFRRHGLSYAPDIEAATSTPAPAACEKRPRHRLCAGCSAPRPRHRAPAPARGPAGAGRLPHPPHGPAPQRRGRRTRNDASFAAEQVK